jgi:hypothetical protein
MSNEAFETIPLLAVLAEVAALVWALARRNAESLALVNALGAAGLTLIVGPKLGGSIEFADVLFLAQLAVLGFALTTLATSLSWLARPANRPWLVWAEFSVLSSLSLAVLAFIVAAKSARLI